MNREEKVKKNITNSNLWLKRPIKHKSIIIQFKEKRDGTYGGLITDPPDVIKEEEEENEKYKGKENR